MSGGVQAKMTRLGSEGSSVSFWSPPPAGVALTAVKIAPAMPSTVARMPPQRAASAERVPASRLIIRPTTSWPNPATSSTSAVTTK